MALRKGKRNLKLQVSEERPVPVTPPRNLDKRTTITIGEKTFIVEADDLETLCILGRGAYGVVDKMKHKQSGTIMAVKLSNKNRILMMIPQRSRNVDANQIEVIKLQL